MTDAPSRTDTESYSFAVSCVAVWLALAAIGQLLYVGQWPVFVLGVRVPVLLGMGVAFARLGIYSGLAWGVLHRDPVAWAGTVMELARTFVVFVVHSMLRDGSMPAEIYPASWADGLLAGALPIVWGLNVLLSGGWRPGPTFETDVATAVRLIAALAGITAVWFRRRAPLFGVPKEAHWTTLVTRGLPVVAILSLVELAALLLTPRGGP